MLYRSSSRSGRRGRLLPTRSLRLGRRRRIHTLCERICRAQKCTKSPKEHSTRRAYAAMSRDLDGASVASIGAEGPPSLDGSRTWKKSVCFTEMPRIIMLGQSGPDLCFYHVYILSIGPCHIDVHGTTRHVYHEGFSLCSQGKTTALPSCILIIENVLLGSRFCNHSAATRPDCLLISLVA